MLVLDPHQAQQFLETLHARLGDIRGSAFIEVRGKREGEELGFRRFYQCVTALVEDMKSWPPDQNYWVGVAPRRSNRGGKKEDCLALTACFGDVDVGNVGHKVATKYKDKASALAVIERFPLRPSILVDSGGGFQPYWLFREAVSLTNGHFARLERINKGLSVALGGDVGATDAARILRLPGTYNMKLAGNPRPVKILWHEPDRVYDLADLARYEVKPKGQRESTREGAAAGPRSPVEYAAYAQAVFERELIALARTHERNRNNRLNQAAFSLGQLIGAGLLDRGSVEAALYGVALHIGLAEAEIRSTIKSGIEAGIKEPRDLPEKEPKAKEGQKAQDISHEKQDETQEQGKNSSRVSSQSERTRTNHSAIHFISAAELEAMEFPDPEWIVGDILPEGYVILGARPKKGKSWMALGLSVSVSSGGCALSKADLRVAKGKVLYLCLEDKLRRAKKRLKQILGGESFPEDLILAESWPRLDKGGLEALGEWLKEHSDCRMVVIDSFTKIKPPRPKHIDPYDFDMAVGGALQNLAQKYRICLLMIYHTRKSAADDLLDEIMGSTGIAGAADAVLVLKRGRGEADGTLNIAGRDVEELELALKFHKQEGMWELLGAAEEYARSKERQEILQILRENGPLTPRQVSGMLGKNYGNIKTLMWKMAKDQEIKSVNGKYESLKR
ncbi:MAG: hypothetical protein FJ134_12925 [Deltaproteobacteria bacterium]|nr:hypothetical protein [Deltaproteobacteria bacterium]